jgi:hypothetical protein
MGSVVTRHPLNSSTFIPVNSGNQQKCDGGRSPGHTPASRALDVRCLLDPLGRLLPTGCVLDDQVHNLWVRGSCLSRGPESSQTHS